MASSAPPATNPYSRPRTAPTSATASGGSVWSATYHPPAAEPGDVIVGRQVRPDAEEPRVDIVVEGRAGWWRLRI